MRLITFGCSYTYGHGLDDCLSSDGITHGSEPSRLSFPAILSNRLNCDYVNLAKPGNSNKEIWHDILNFDFNSSDVALTTWTYFTRFCIIKSNYVKRINPWKNDSKAYYMNYCDRHDMILDFYTRINHIHYYLQSKRIKNLNYVIDLPKDLQPVWNVSKVLGSFNMIDKASDDCHPGPVSHTKFAYQVYKDLIKLSSEDKHLK